MSDTCCECHKIGKPWRTGVEPSIPWYSTVCRYCAWCNKHQSYNYGTGLESFGINYNNASVRLDDFSNGVAVTGNWINFGVCSLTDENGNKIIASTYQGIKKLRPGLSTVSGLLSWQYDKYLNHWDTGYVKHNDLWGRDASWRESEMVNSAFSFRNPFRIDHWHETGSYGGVYALDASYHHRSGSRVLTGYNAIWNRNYSSNSIPITQYKNLTWYDGSAKTWQINVPPDLASYHDYKNPAVRNELEMMEIDTSWWPMNNWTSSEQPYASNINQPMFQYHGDVKVRQENYFKYHCVVDPDKNMTTEPSGAYKDVDGLIIDNSDNCYTNRNFDIHSKTTQIAIFGYHDGQSLGNYVFTGGVGGYGGLDYDEYYDFNYWTKRTGDIPIYQGGTAGSAVRALYGYSEPTEYLHHHFELNGASSTGIRITGTGNAPGGYRNTAVFLNEPSYWYQAYNQRYLLAKHSTNGTIQRIGFLSGGKNLPLISLNNLTGIFPRLEVNCSWEGGEWVGSCDINYNHTDPINIAKTKIFDFYDLDEVNDRYPFVQDASAQILTWTPTSQVNITLEDQGRGCIKPNNILWWGENNDPYNTGVPPTPFDTGNPVYPLKISGFDPYDGKGGDPVDQIGEYASLSGRGWMPNGFTGFLDKIGTDPKVQSGYIFSGTTYGQVTSFTRATGVVNWATSGNIYVSERGYGFSPGDDENVPFSGFCSGAGNHWLGQGEYSVSSADGLPSEHIFNSKRMIRVTRGVRLLNYGGNALGVRYAEFTGNGSGYSKYYRYCTGIGASASQIFTEAEYNLSELLSGTYEYSPNSWNRNAIKTINPQWIFFGFLSNWNTENVPTGGDWNLAYNYFGTGSGYEGWLSPDRVGGWPDEASFYTSPYMNVAQITINKAMKGFVWTNSSDPVGATWYCLDSGGNEVAAPFQPNFSNMSAGDIPARMNFTGYVFSNEGVYDAFDRHIKSQLGSDWELADASDILGSDSTVNSESIIDKYTFIAKTGEPDPSGRSMPSFVSNNTGKIFTCDPRSHQTYKNGSWHYTGDGVNEVTGKIICFNPDKVSQTYVDQISYHGRYWDHASLGFGGDVEYALSQLDESVRITGDLYYGVITTGIIDANTKHYDFKAIHDDFLMLREPCFDYWLSGYTGLSGSQYTSAHFNSNVISNGAFYDSRLSRFSSRDSLGSSDVYYNRVGREWRISNETASPGQYYNYPYTIFHRKTKTPELPTNSECLKVKSFYSGLGLELDANELNNISGELWPLLGTGKPVSHEYYSDTSGYNYKYFGEALNKLEYEQIKCCSGETVSTDPDCEIFTGRLLTGDAEYTSPAYITKKLKDPLFLCATGDRINFSNFKSGVTDTMYTGASGWRITTEVAFGITQHILYNTGCPTDVFTNGASVDGQYYTDDFALSITVETGRCTGSFTGTPPEGGTTPCGIPDKTLVIDPQLLMAGGCINLVSGETDNNYTGSAGGASITLVDYTQFGSPDYYRLEFYDYISYSTASYARSGTLTGEYTGITYGIIGATRQVSGGTCADYL
jgi:hypothetical protein